MPARVSHPARGSRSTKLQIDYDHPDAVALRESLQRFYVERYGGPDNAPEDPDEFRPPRGACFVGYLDGRPVAAGAWHSVGVDRLGTTRTAEFKRVHVIPEARRRGLARRMMSELEITARKAGYEAAVLSTGLRQYESIAMYEQLGYARIEGFGHYADDDIVIFFGRRL
ncbi:GNAT family N-acetyltransferase [Microtetraspora sp. NBRC 13810]|uniref:GNAT family N-acetyltransferase n=1 Tax=Microtetraspora sp. NBRC 13810 TaxID=3030990 RepID=UPI0025541325|nr:GNAT family N-acetyltransferase [Microtetraspora sp. NBRC 13810]